MEPRNLLFILSDEHTRRALGCYGHSLVRTPNLDRLAAGGTRFAAAYSNSPLCVPSRASLATGRHVHETRCWDNGHPYEGHVPGWPHRLRDAGHPVVAIGKLHYRDSRHENGFSEEILPMHVRYGIGDLLGLVRNDPPSYGHVPASLAREAGAGESNHTEYDRRITQAACDWLHAAASRPPSKPWTLLVSLVSPHFPLVAPEEFFALYPPEHVDWPIAYAPELRPQHPVIQALARSWNYDDFFDDDKVRVARAAYYGLCSFLDANVGRILDTLDACGLADSTRILYSSDHGELLGNRGLWSTSAMYEESVGIPMILAGPDVPRGHVVSTPVSLVDCHPTILAGAGIAASAEDETLPGASLFDVAAGAVADRPVISQYHAGGSITGSFMIRDGRWKYVHYVGHPPQLFDLESDPLELADLGTSASSRDVRERLRARMRAVLDPDEVNALAFSDQAATMARHGGRDAVLQRGHPGEHTRDRPLGVDVERVS